MKYRREHVDTFTVGAAKAILDDLGIEALPTYRDTIELATEATGRYVMVLAKDDNYDVLYEHWNLQDKTMKQYRVTVWGNYNQDKKYCYVVGLSDLDNYKKQLKMMYNRFIIEDTGRKL